MKQFDWLRNVIGLFGFFHPASPETQQPALVSAPKPRSETDFKLKNLPKNLIKRAEPETAYE
jgi:hypothetical protein